MSLARSASYLAEPYSYPEARAIAEGLGLSEPVAITLVRRGYRTVGEARSFLEAQDSHSPLAFEGMERVVERVLAAASAGEPIVVHGDYDVDGVCATALLIEALRELGAECSWYIPDRLGEGYGISSAAIERLSARGTSLLITADCGIGAAEQVALAKAAGIEVIVTDHHAPGPELPDCPILHPALCGYPFEELCGTGVAYKLCEALGEAAPGRDLRCGENLDLVALATVADLVPLVGENRTLVRRGLAVARRAGRAGLRALMAASGTDPARLDEGDLAFRLAPRINAAGRLYRADAGVELMLSRDDARAAQIAAELDRANRERRETERAVEVQAQAALRELPEEQRDAPAIVLAGSGWHPGVVGIVASRLVERHHRPSVVISLDERGGGRGSARSIPGFHLVRALEACREHLGRFGGHSAAAGLEISAERVEGFRAAFLGEAAARLGEADLIRTERVDALVGGAALGLELAEELGRLGPFGVGNPGVRLLVPSARLSDVRAMGEGRHARFSLSSGGRSALGVVFGSSSLPVSAEEPIDASVRIEVNRWNGAIEPRLILRELYRLNGSEDGVRGSGHGAGCPCEPEEWWRRFEAELGLAPGVRPGPDVTPEGVAARKHVSWGSSAVAILAELLSSGQGVLALCADASRRAELAAGAAGLARFAGGRASVVCARCPGDGLAVAARHQAEGGLLLTDYAALARSPEVCGAFSHLVAIDPPAFAEQAALLGRAGEAPAYLHRAFGEAERRFALKMLELEYGLEGQLRSLYGAMRVAGELRGEPLRALLMGEGAHPRSPEQAARLVRVLSELGLIDGAAKAGAGSLRVVSSKSTKLERSGAFCAYRERLAEGQRYLESQRQP